jgi:hypothetical protein
MRYINVLESWRRNQAFPIRHIGRDIHDHEGDMCTYTQTLYARCSHVGTRIVPCEICEHPCAQPIVILILRDASCPECLERIREMERNLMLAMLDH